MDHQIKKTILQIESPFNIADLVIKFNREGITNERVITRALDDLLDAGLVDRVTLDGDREGYLSIYAKKN